MRVAVVLAAALVPFAACDRSEAPKPEPAEEQASGPMSAGERDRIGGEILFVSEASGRLELAAVTPAGQLRSVASDPERDLFPASASPLLVIATEGDHHDHREQLVLLDGGERRPLGPVTSKVRNPSWSPDGRWLVFESDHQSFRDLYRVDADSGEVRRLTTSEHGNFEPQVSPDGQRIAFVSSRDGNAEVYVMDAGGGAEERLTAFHRDDWAPRWSPDGRTLAFMSDREGVERIYLMNPDGTNQRRLTARTGETGETHESELTWSPDGSRIAYVLRGAHGSEVWVTEVATGTSRRISDPGARDDANPAWSPDGAYLVFSSRHRGNTDLHMVRADGTGRVRLTTAPGADWLPRWSAERPRS